MMFTVIAGLVALVGLGTVVWNYRDIRHSEQITTWPTIEGAVTVSVVEPVARGGGGVEHPITREASIAAYRPLVIFEYHVNGQSYLGNAYAYVSGARQWAEEQVDAHPVGSTIVAYRDPRRLHHVVRYRDEGREATFGVIIGGLLCLGGVAGVVVGLR